MRLARASWLIVLTVIIITAAVPTLRHQVPLGLRSAMPGGSRLGDTDAFLQVTMQPYRKRAAAFAEEHYPNDGEMLLAAGIVADDTDLLRRAAETGDDPVAWAAYGERLMQMAPAFERIAISGIDPADSEAVAEEEKRIADSGYPDRLYPEQVDRIISPLRKWQNADPENALPLAMETRLLYGLHRDRKALDTWSRAGQMPIVTPHAIDRAKPVERLLVAMGMPEPEALLNSQMLLVLPSFSLLRDTARIAAYEGRLAALHGDPTAAVTWWQSTADLGRHMQESADFIIGVLVGAAVQGIGAHPVWQWTSDSVSGIPDGPLLGGRYFWGDHHDLYVTHMGETNDRALLDALVMYKLRTQATRGYTTSSDNMFEAYLNATRFLALAAWILVPSLILFVIFLAVRASSGRTPAALGPAGWRGHLLRIIPVAIALCALLFLGLNVYAASLRSAWYEQWSTPGVTEMTDMLRTLGDSWTNPTIPPDAYRAQYPPEASP